MRQLIIFGIVFLAGSAKAQLANSGAMKLFAGASVALYGDLTNNGTFTDSGTVVTLNGAADQTIGGTAPVTFNNLTLNNSSAGGITLGQDLNVRGTLTLANGYLNTSAANVLEIGAASAVTGASNSSFVSGPVAKTGNTAFVFPVGKNLVYAPIAISAPAAPTDRFTAEYFQTSPDALYSTSLKEPSLYNISQCEYWMLERTTGTSDVTVNLSWDTRSCGVTVLADLRVARWDGSQWINEGNGGTTGNATAGTINTEHPQTSFGPFTLASATSQNSLPVELIGFAAQCENEQAVIRWSTASELHNDFFTIESSPDALEWETAAIVEGAGTTTALTHYAWTDLSNPGRDTYYRLKQTDTDGETRIHDIVHLESCSAFPAHAIAVYPNPAKGIVNILSETEITDIIVLNAAGKAIGVPVDPSGKQLDLGQVPDGVYIVRIVTGNGLFNEKVVVSHN